jgi:hypothetical protein
MQLQRYPAFPQRPLAEADIMDKLDFNTVNSRMAYLDAVIMGIN